MLEIHITIRQAPTGVPQLVGHCSAKQKELVRFPVRAHAWVAGLVPGQTMWERQPIDVSLTLMLLPLFLPLLPSL